MRTIEQEIDDRQQAILRGEDPGPTDAQLAAQAAEDAAWPVERTVLANDTDLLKALFAIQAAQKPHCGKPVPKRHLTKLRRIEQSIRDLRDDQEEMRREGRRIVDAMGPA